MALVDAKKWKTHKNGECGVDQAVRSGSWYMLRNKEEIAVFCCPSPKSQMVAGEVWEPVAGTASEGLVAAGQCCESGQMQWQRVGQEQGQGSRELSGFLHLRRVSKALCLVRYRS